MTITQQLGSLGSWSIDLVPDTPRSVTDALGFFGHLAVWRGRVDVEQSDDETLLSTARYVGVLREKPAGRTSLEGSGMIYWLGDEDGKGAVLENPVTFTNATLTHCVTTLLPPAVTVGTIHDPGGTYTGTHQWQTPRAVLDTITAAFGVEYRVNGNATIDVGTQAQLYGTTTSTIISARGAGQDFDLTSLGATFTTDTAVVDYSSRIVVLGQKTDAAGTSTPFAEGSADALSFPYKDLHGNTVHITRTVSDTGQTDASAPAAAAVQLNLYNRAKRALTIRADDYDTTGTAVVGQNAYVFDPENGLYDPTQQIDFRGELIFPVLIRISALQWSITDGHTVAFRTQDGVWVDLTRWVSWDPGSDQVTVGDLPRTLTTGSNPVLDQTQSAPDSSIPNPPTGLALTTTSYESSAGQSVATISASWTAPATNTDGTVITDLSYYLVQYRPQFRAPLWSTLGPVAATEVDIPGLPVGLVYDVQVAAVDTTGHQSAWTAIASITAAPDSTAPNPPSDPVVSSYLGQLRIAWDGKDNAGAAMPPDFAIVEVHVSATSGFTPDSSPGSATLVSELSTAGVAYATAPYGSARYVKLVAVDNSGNRSAPSGQASGATVQVADGDIAALSVGKLTAGTMSADVVVSGRFATALTGGRVEMNSLGFQKFASDGVTKLISLTGTEALLTGTYKTALTGRRVEIGSGGTTGEIDFYAPDGTEAFISAYTEGTGLEALQFGIIVPAANTLGGAAAQLWNRINFNNDHGGWANYRANRHEFVMGGPNSAGGGDSSHSGWFQIAQTSAYGNDTVISRFTLDTGLTYVDKSNVTRLQITDTSFSYWGSNGNGRIIIDPSTTTIYDPLAGPRFTHDTGSTQLFAPGGAIFAVSGGNNEQTAWMRQFTWGLLGSAIISAGDDSSGTNWRTELKWWDGSVWTPWWASAYIVPSDEALKTGIRDLDRSAALEHVRSMRPRRYRRKAARGHPMGSKRTAAIPGPEEIGIVAQEAPDIVRADSADTASISLYPLLVTTIAALQAVDDRVSALEGGTP